MKQQYELIIADPSVGRDFPKRFPDGTFDRVRYCESAPTDRRTLLDIVNYMNHNDSRKVIVAGKSLFYLDRDQLGTEAILAFPESSLVCYPLTTVYAGLDAAKLAERNILLAYAPGSNKDAVREWILDKTLELVRSFSVLENTLEIPQPVTRAQGLGGLKATILGPGIIGKHVGALYQFLGMDVTYFGRRTKEEYGLPKKAKYMDNLAEAVKDADVVVNLLSLPQVGKPAPLGRDFFLRYMPQGSRFISVTNPRVWDSNAFIEAMTNSNLSGAAIDVGNKGPLEHTELSARLVELHQPGDHLIVTAQSAHFTRQSQETASAMIEKSIRAFVAGKPVEKIPNLWQPG